MNELVDMHLDCIEKVLQNDYYVNLFQEVSERTGLMWSHPETNEIDDMMLYRLEDPEKIVSFWNKFWYALLDNNAIHRVPFNHICNICEYDYRDDIK